MKRIRIFAGPNGSGKSTLVKQFIEDDPWLINTQLHIDPDKLNITNIIDFGKFGIHTNISEFKEHILGSTLFPISRIDIQDIKFGLCRNRQVTISTVGRCNHREHRVHGDG